MPDDKEILNDNPEQDHDDLSKKYKKIELGDINPPVSQAPASVPLKPTLPQQGNTSTQDPLSFWPQITSGGYKPSLRVVQNVSQLLKNKKVEWSDTWFSVLFQKILKKVKYEKEQGK